MLIEAHNKAVVKALTAFSESSIGNAEVKQKYKRDLWSFFAKAFEVISLLIYLLYCFANKPAPVLRPFC